MGGGETGGVDGPIGQSRGESRRHLGKCILHISKPQWSAPHGARARLGLDGIAEVVQGGCAGAVSRLGRGLQLARSWGLSVSEHVAGVHISQTPALPACGSVSGLRFQM